MKLWPLEKSDKPILTRWYLFRSVRLGIKVHKLKGDEAFHNHPWWGISFHLKPYREEFEDQPGAKHFRWLVNIVSPFRRHKVHVTKPVFSFFINFHRVNDKWTYGEQTKPWRGADTDPIINA